jgi:hypothetical protein
VAAQKEIVGGIAAVAAGLVAAIIFLRAIWYSVLDWLRRPGKAAEDVQGEADGAQIRAVRSADLAMTHSFEKNCEQESSIWFFLRLGTFLTITELAVAGYLAFVGDIDGAKAIGNLVTVFGAFLGATAIICIGRLKSEKQLILHLREVESIFERKISLLHTMSAEARDQGICDLIQAKIDDAPVPRKT